LKNGKSDKPNRNVILTKNRTVQGYKHLILNYQK
jgi:hypothetical protein